MVDFGPLGISINQCPELKRTFSGELLIVGSARCVWEDLEKYPNDGHYYRVPDVMCINDMIMHFPGRIIHGYSNDHHMLPNWVAARRPRFKKDLSESIYLHSCYGAKYTWPWPGTGSSGLNACYTGLALGYEQITLAGVPLTDEGHYFDPPWKKTNFTREVPNRNDTIRYWETGKIIFNGRVRSLSGRTRDLLGA